MTTRNLKGIILFNLLIFLFTIFAVNSNNLIKLSANTTLGTKENPHIIDDESDFILMNGSSDYFELSKSITISDSTGFLGIENFSGVFEGNGYSILNTDGPFVINLTGEINDVTFDSPKQFTASTSEDIKQLGITGNRYSFLLKLENPNISNTINGKPQYFGYVCSKIDGGSLNNVRVTNATIDTNSHTDETIIGPTSTIAYIGFIAGQASNAQIFNCTVDNSNLVYSTCYALGGLIGSVKDSSIYGSLVTDLNITTKPGLQINQMTKAYSGLIAGIFTTSRANNNIVMNISQGDTPYLSMYGYISCYSLSLSYTFINHSFYDETVAPFSTNYYTDDQYEVIYNRDSEDLLNVQNASCDSYGSIYDGENNNLDRHHGIRIKYVNEFYNSTTRSIIFQYNSNIKSGEKTLLRSVDTLLPEGYVAEYKKTIGVNVEIDEITYGDRLFDKITATIDYAKTNFDTDIRIQYKPAGWPTFQSITENTLVTMMSFEWKIIYQSNSNWYDYPDLSGTVEVKPYDISNAEISYSKSYAHGDYENKVLVSVFTKETNVSLSFDLSGTTSASELGTYTFTITGKENSTGSVDKEWEIYCTHKEYSPATCNEPETCTVCGEQRGTVLEHIDENLDHICDLDCGKTDYGLHIDENLDHICDYGCNVSIGDHIDNEDSNHLCDYGCGNVADEGCYEVEINGICDECGLEIIHECLDEDKDHACDICAKNVGVHQDLDNNHLCDYGCGDLVDNGCLDEDNDYYCDKCGKELSHNLGDYLYDSTGHWKECNNENCSHKAEKEEHEYSEWKIIEEPTETKVGKKIKVCICGHEVVEDIPVIDSKGNDKTLIIVASVIAGIGFICACYFFIFKKNKK